jgi:hypothetical protein
MGTLKPGAKYIYEKANGKTYAREFGTNDRKLVGVDVDRVTLDEIREWGNIVMAGKSNPALQKALDRAKLLYKLGENYDRS